MSAFMSQTTVEVLVVDHGNVAGPKPRHEVLRPAVDAGDALLLAAATDLRTPAFPDHGISEMKEEIL